MTEMLASAFTKIEISIEVFITLIEGSGEVLESQDSRYLSTAEPPRKSEHKLSLTSPLCRATSDTLPSASRYSRVRGQCNATPAMYNNKNA